MAKHSKQPSTKSPSPHPSFLRSSKAVWLVELLVLVVIGVIVYNDWDAPLRDLSPLSTTSYVIRYDEFAEPHIIYDTYSKFFRFTIYALITLLIASIVAQRRDRLELCMRIASLAYHEAPMLAQDFLDMRSRLVASRMLQESEFTGVYILHNVDKDKYYVGQSIRVLSRITQHLTGHGNGDVYADFKYGDCFTVSTIPMQGSGYQSLNDLERDTISAYNAKEQGYNMTRGNRR